MVPAIDPGANRVPAHLKPVRNLTGAKVGNSERSSESVGKIKLQRFGGNYV